MPRAAKYMTSLICMCLMMVSIGCATFHIPFGPERFEKATARNPVTQIVCIWQPSEGRDPNGLPCRGFAGQILFLAGRNSLPVQVEGDVRVYLFDDQGSLDEQARPIHQFDFDAKTWAPHLTKGTLGPTYSVFIPYTRRGVHEAVCALRVRLNVPNQQPVFSDMASISLDGRSKKTNEAERPNPTAEEAKAATEAASNSLRRTTTISMKGETKSAEKSPSSGFADRNVEPARDSSDKVQLANYVEGAESGTAESKRIEQLEQLVQQLLQQQNGTQAVEPTRSKVEPASATESHDSQRSRLRMRENTQSSTNGSGKTPSESRPRELTMTSAEPARLLVEATSAQTNARSSRELLANHPLASLDEELTESDTFLPSPRSTQPQPLVDRRKELLPAAGKQHRSQEPAHREPVWDEGFGPINTDAVETTSVEADTSRRQRLRAAR